MDGSQLKVLSQINSSRQNPLRYLKTNENAHPREAHIRRTTSSPTANASLTFLDTGLNTGNQRRICTLRPIALGSNAYFLRAPTLHPHIHIRKKEEDKVGSNGVAGQLVTRVAGDLWGGTGPPCWSQRDLP